MADAAYPAHDAAARRKEVEEALAHNRRILDLIRDEPGWALSRILLAERLEIAVDHVVSDSPGTPDSVKGYLRDAKFAHSFRTAIEADRG